MRKNFTVSITDDILKRSKPGTSKECMVAMAVREQIPGAWSVNVSSDSIRFNLGGERDDEGTRYSFPTPALAAMCIQKFDDGKKVRPFRLRLQAAQCYTSPVLKRGSQRKSRHKKKTRQRPAARCTVRRFHGIRLIEGAA